MRFDPLLRAGFLPPLEALRRLQAPRGNRFDEPVSARSLPLAFALYRRDDALLLRTPLPGVEPSDLTLEVEGDVLTLSGRFAEEPEAGSALAQHVERPRGAFRRTLHLPFEVDAAGVEARLERGLLEVRLPRLQKTPPVTIPVVPEARRNPS